MFVYTFFCYLRPSPRRSQMGSRLIPPNERLHLSCCHLVPQGLPNAQARFDGRTHKRFESECMGKDIGGHRAGRVTYRGARRGLIKTGVLQGI